MITFNEERVPSISPLGNRKVSISCNGNELVESENVLDEKVELDTGLRYTD
jgi:hypothetical protein